MQIRGESVGDKKNAAGPATPTASSVDSCFALSPHGDGMTASVRHASAPSSESAPPWPKRVAHSSSCDDKGATAAAASGPCSWSLFVASAPKSERPNNKEQEGGGRNARATSRVRARF